MVDHSNIQERLIISIYDYTKEWARLYIEAGYPVTNKIYLNMAKGDYYFPLYYKRLLSSTIGWTDDEFGAYVRLLIYQFDNGYIPAEIKDLVRIAPSAKKNWPLISKKFNNDGNGGLVNEVMLDVYDKIQNKKAVSKKNGKSGGRPPRKLVTQKNPVGSFQVSKNNLIPIINNQQPKEGANEAPPDQIRGEVFYDAEQLILSNRIEFERICMATNKTNEAEVKKSLKKFHLYLQENEKYPRTKKSLFAGFERWLMNEQSFLPKNAEVNQQPTAAPLRRLN